MLFPYSEIPQFKYDLREGTLYKAIVEKSADPMTTHSKKTFILKVLPRSNDPLSGLNIDREVLRDLIYGRLLIKNFLPEQTKLIYILKLLEDYIRVEGDGTGKYYCNLKENKPDAIKAAVDILREILHYQPIDINNVPDQRKVHTGLLFCGSIRFRVWQLIPEGSFKEVISSAMYGTDSVEMTYLNPVEPEWVMANEAILLENKLITNQVKSWGGDIEALYDLRSKIFNY